MPDLDLVNVSRLQFAVTTLYHFLFVPLTLGLSWILVIMESVYVMTGREIYHLYGGSNDGSRKNPRGVDSGGLRRIAA